MMNWFHKKKHPTFVCDYLAAAKLRKKRQRPLSAERIVVLDTETEGLSLDRDEILSLALFEIVDGRIDLSRRRDWLVYHPDTRPNRATAIHGILPSQTENGIPEQVMMEELLPILSDALIVCHHVGFDLSRISKVLQRHFNIRFKTRALDTAVLAMHELPAFHKTGYPNQRMPTLDDVCAQLDLPIIGRHTAEGDAFMTAEIFLFLCGRLQRRLGRPLQVGDLPTIKF